MNELLDYVEFGIDAGCPEDQLENFVRAGITLQPRQLAASAAARLCDATGGPTFIGYGGARGGGKSYWLLAQMGADDCQRFPGLKCLLLRKVGKSNLENLEDLRRRLFSRLPHEFAPSRGVLTFANGSRIVAGHFQCEKDIDAYLGLEYDVIGIEEATTLTARKHADITTCCRSSKAFSDGRPWRPRVYSTTNPGGVGHAWYRAKFITPFHARAETDTRFIPARVTDNSFTNPEYAHVLENLSGWQKRAWFEGDWDIAAGQFFTTFRREAHVIDDFDERRARHWYCALDYGFNHPTVVLLACTDADENLYIVDEHAERLWLPERHAQAIQAMLARHTFVIRGVPRLSSADPYPYTRPLELKDVRRFWAGTDVFGKQSDGTSVADQYRRHGISLFAANTDRVNGWAEVLSRLGDPHAGIRPRLFIHSRCTRLIETIPALQHDPHRPEDVLKTDIGEEGVGGDDAADALRYIVASRVPTVHVRKLVGL